MTDLNESAQISIDAPPSVVFAILTDPTQHSRIDGSGTVRDSFSAPERLELGSSFGMTMKMGAPYKIKNKVVEFEQDKLITWRHMGVHRWRNQLEPTATGTQVTETWDLTAYNPIGRRVLHGLFGKKTAKALQATMIKLKAAAEADAQA
jgi:uncharacterized protein YndB with AHSA1/START domain